MQNLFNLFISDEVVVLHVIGLGFIVGLSFINNELDKFYINYYGEREEVSIYGGTEDILIKRLYHLDKNDKEQIITAELPEDNDILAKFN